MPAFIAEVKTQSPFGFRAKLRWEVLLEIAVEAGDMISVHTDPRWGGSFDLLAKARKATAKPILAKGIHEQDDDIRRAVDLGADAVLVVGRLPPCCFEHCWIEPRFLIDLQSIPSNMNVVWNTRDLRYGNKKLEPWDSARKQWEGWLCQASGISKLSDIDPKADAFLVGEHMITVAKQLKRIDKRKLISK